MQRMISALITAGLACGLNAAIAQNVDKDQVIAGQRAYNDVGERQVGLEQLLADEQQCGAMSADTRGDCMHMAKVRYEGWAIMQCDLVAGASRQRCYENIQAATMSNRNPGDAAVRRGGEEDKPGRQ